MSSWLTETASGWLQPQDSLNTHKRAIYKGSIIKAQWVVMIMQSPSPECQIKLECTPVHSQGNSVQTREDVHQPSNWQLTCHGGMEIMEIMWSNMIPKPQCTGKRKCVLNFPMTMNLSWRCWQVGRQGQIIIYNRMEVLNYSPSRLGAIGKQRMMVVEGRGVWESQFTCDNMHHMTTK